MGVLKKVKNSFTSGLNAKNWVGVNEHRQNIKLISGLSKVLFRRDAAETTKGENGQYASFEECMRRYNLTEEGLQNRMKNAKKIVIFCIVAFVVVLAYMFYLLSSGEIISGMVCLVLSLLMLVYGLREHFNLFQMKQRRLGCSFKEWVADTLKGGK